ncbi:MAG: YidC/Oxa1 family insertase periplasmic-domain containing protein [Planctomycetes bacterium]|nr:YidC/Oxa1 family insertase periplasmic-domain containing protein [Planctomycetota bacterium]
MHRKEMIPMVITILVIVAGFYAVQHFFFPAKPLPANVSNEPVANAPATNTPAANTPAANEPAATPTPAPETRPTTAAADRGFVPVARKDARTWTLANSRLTATITERGALVESLRFVDSDGKPVYLRTPNNPTREPTEVLEILRPMEHTQHAAPLALRMDDNDPWRNTSRWELVSGPQRVDGAETITLRFPPASFTAEADDTVVYKTIALYPDTYRLEVTLRVENHGAKAVEKMLGLWGAAAMTNDGAHTGGEHSRVALYGSTASKRYTDLFQEPAIPSLAKEVANLNEDRVSEGRKAVTQADARELDDVTNPDRYLLAHGARTQFFLAFLAADPLNRNARWSGEVLPIHEINDAALSLIAPPVAVPALAAGKPGEAQVRLSFYCGPRDKETLTAAWLALPPQDDDLLVEWVELAPTGFPAVISGPMVWLLRKLTGWVGPGFAIILLTLIVRTLLSPLSYRGQKSMAVYTAKMKVVKPKLDKIKEKYQGKKDRDSQMKMLTETREAMREQNVGMLPLGGCLPMLIQLPIFIGLYRAFGSAFFLRQAEFLWIHDLSLPDATIPFSYDVNLGFLSFLTYNGVFTLNLLPMAWIGLSLLQMKMQPKPDDPQQAAMQKQMGCIFPLMGLLFYSFASGFAFYFIVSSMYSIGESKLIKRNLIKLGITPPPSKNKPKADDKPDYHAA